MKITVVDGRVHAVAETAEDISLLMSGQSNRQTVGNEVRQYGLVKRVYNKKRTPEKPSKRIECRLCGKSVRGRKGMALHQRLRHADAFLANGKHAVL